MGAVLEPEDGGATPLTHEEMQGLRLPHIALRSELNAAEQENIATATERARRRKFVLNEPSLNKLHGEMFGDVWEWAGTFRTTNKNIGIPYHQIATNLRVLLDDCKYWIDHNTYPLDEIAARFHHRLVAIHPYPNGNGRHARLATELFLKSLRRPPFTWGSETGTDDAATRQRYIAALQAADANNYEPLLAFVRS